MKAAEIEEAIYRFFNKRQYTVVPNVYWGLNLLHEVDVFVCNQKSRWAQEVEIKVSKSDILADKKKKKWRIPNNELISKLWFAVPAELEDYALQHIPDHAGLITVKRLFGERLLSVVNVARKPKKIPGTRKLTEDEFLQLLRLGCMRLHRNAIERAKYVRREE